MKIREITEYPGYYVTDDGRVLSTKTGTLKMKAQRRTHAGHRAVTLYHPQGGTKTIKVHHLVADCFLPPRQQGQEMRHLDGNPTNNRPENLRWGTSKENAQDRARHGTDRSGERSSTAKLTWSQVREIRRRWEEGEGFRPLAREYGVYHSTIMRMVKGESWKNTSRK